MFAVSSIVCFDFFCDHPATNVLTHSFPTRRSSDLATGQEPRHKNHQGAPTLLQRCEDELKSRRSGRGVAQPGSASHWGCGGRRFESSRPDQKNGIAASLYNGCDENPATAGQEVRSEEHTSELKSLMRASSAVISLHKKYNIKQ